ncbi:MAG: hypothetical protein V9E87_16860 [Gemmatimonadales bacterium]
MVLVGHSYGASVDDGRWRPDDPERVAGMVLLDPAGDFSYVPPEAIAGFLAGLDHEAHFAETVEGAFEVALEGSSAETERRVRAAILAAPRPMIRKMYHSLLRFKPLASALRRVFWTATTRHRACERRIRLRCTSCGQTFLDRRSPRSPTG